MIYQLKFIMFLHGLFKWFQIFNYTRFKATVSSYINYKDRFSHFSCMLSERFFSQTVHTTNRLNTLKMHATITQI